MLLDLFALCLLVVSASHLANLSGALFLDLTKINLTHMRSMVPLISPPCTLRACIRMSTAGDTTTSISIEKRGWVGHKLVGSKASSSLHKDNVSVNSKSLVPTAWDASKSLARLAPEVTSENPRVEPKASESHQAPESESHSDWTVYTKKALDNNKKDVDLTEEDKLALMALDHFIEGMKSHIVPSERNWFLEFKYTKVGDQMVPYIKISTKCGCDHAMAGEHVGNGKHLKGGKPVRYSLAEHARWIRKNWEYDDCKSDTDGKDKARSERTFNAKRTKAL